MPSSWSGPARTSRWAWAPSGSSSTALTRSREETVELVPDRGLSYALLSGFPFVDYRADVDLSPGTDGGTSIDWRASFDPKYPGTGWFWRLFMTAVLRKVASDLADAADARAA